jgi:hypothetical protein
MQLSPRKMQLIHWIEQLENENLLAEIEKLFQNSAIADYEAKLKPMTQAELEQRIEQAEQDYQTGKVKSLSEIQAKYQ